MKKLIIGSLVATLLLFGWQSLSWTALHVHDDAYRYTAEQDTLLSSIRAHLPTEGQYYIPRLPDNASPEDMEKMEEQMNGKPWAVVTYHETYKAGMGSRILRGFLIGLFCSLIVCLVIQKLALKSFWNVFSTVITFALVSFFYVWYNQQIWFDVPWSVLKGEMIDIFASWGLCGIWLGWWYSRK
jgi:hypothetical protein